MQRACNGFDGCSGFGYVVESINSAAIPAGHQMAVDIDRDLHRGVPHLLFDVDQRFPLLNQQTGERVPEIVDAMVPQLGLAQNPAVHLPHVRLIEGRTDG